jgi:thiol-disulfide isomerase/thioredoxin
MASVITLAITSSVSLGAVFVTFAYAFGTALPMLAIMLGGRRLLQRAPWLLSRAGQIQRGFGVVMILIAVALQFNLDRKFQTWVLETFPAYGTGLTQLEDNDVVRRRLDALEGDADASPLAPLLDKPAVSAEAEPEETLFNVATPVPAPELTGLQAWINRDPTTLAALRGQVVVVDFWTYSCINCIRTLPYLKTWHDKYADDGLVILGIHAPEFEFEKKLANVEQAVRDFDIAYPVAQDNDFATWRAYGNRYWPAKYFIDREGNIRHYHFGEGAYEESERVIQALLAEGAEMPTAAVEPAADPDYDQRQSPETYLGYWRAANFANALEARQDETMTYTYPAALDRNAWALNGDWEMAEKSLYSRVADAGLRFKFSAKEVYVVMGADTPATVTVTLDGAPLTAVTAGSDVENSRMSVGEYRLYRLIASDKFIEGGLLELSFPDGVELNAFTFGS